MDGQTLGGLLLAGRAAPLFDFDVDDDSSDRC